MLLSVVLTGPAFAQGMQILLGQTGVQRVSSYPKNAQSSDVGGLHASPMYPTLTPNWLGPELDGYSFQTIWMLKPEQWSKGPIVELEYARSGRTSGDGALDIREFRIADQYSSVLQVVQTGAAEEVQLDQAVGVYVDGAWSTQGARSSWKYGARSELI